MNKDKLEILNIPMKYQKAKNRRSKIWAENFIKSNGDKNLLEQNFKGEIINSMKYLNDNFKNKIREWIYE